MKFNFRSTRNWLVPLLVLVVAVSLVSIIIIGLPKGAHVYYIATNGDDSADGSQGSPWASIDNAQNRMKPGDEVLLRGGTYSGEVTISASGTNGYPLVFASYPGEVAKLEAPSGPPGSNGQTVTVTGSYITLDRLHVTNLSQRAPQTGNGSPTGHGVVIEHGANHVTVSNSEIYNCGGQGILTLGDYTYIHKNKIHGNGASPVYDHGVYVEGAHNTVRSNNIYDNLANGIQLYNGGDIPGGGNLIEYNYIFHNGFGSLQPNHSVAGIIIWTGQAGTTVRYNRICGNAQYGIDIGDGESGTVITDNVTCYNAGGGIFLDHCGSTKIANHVSYKDGGFGPVSNDQSSGISESNVQTTDPGFKKIGTDFTAYATAMTYNFCSPTNSALCNALP